MKPMRSPPVMRLTREMVYPRFCWWIEMMSRARRGLNDAAMPRYQPSNFPLAMRKPLPKKQRHETSPSSPVTGLMTRKKPNSFDLSRKPSIAKTPSRYSSHVAIPRVWGCILSNHLRLSMSENALWNTLTVCQARNRNKVMPVKGGGKNLLLIHTCLIF